MPYTYTADRNAPSVHVNLDETDGPGDVAQSDAVDAITRFYAPRPVVVWEKYNISDASNALGGSAKANTLALFLKKIPDLPKPASCLAVFSADDVADEWEEVKQQIDRTLIKLNESPMPGRVLVFVTKGDEASRFLEKKNVAPGRFVRQLSGAPPNLADLVEALSKKPPQDLLPTGEPAYWPWADDEKRVDQIDSLNKDDVKKIVDNNWHQLPLRRMKLALAALQKNFHSRDHAAEMLVACALARVNLVFLGPPGTAKSLLVRAFSETMGVSSGKRPIRDERGMIEEALQYADEAKRANEEVRRIQARNERGMIEEALQYAEEAKKANEEVRRIQARKIPGRRMFEYLLTRYTTPEELFGPAHIELMLSAGIHGRQTHGMLPQAETAFLDEIFKANSAILNTLLSITNERLFYNLGQAFRVNLAFIVGASNETPAEEELGALFDRFPVRVPCRPVAPQHLKQVIKMAHKFDCARELHDSSSKIERVSCLNDLRLLTKVVQGGICGGTEPFGDNQFEDDFNTMLLAVRQGYGVSDRTMVQILRLCRALALLDSDGGDPKIGPRHLRAWGYVAPKFAAARDLQQLVKARIQNSSPDGKATDLFDE